MFISTGPVHAYLAGAGRDSRGRLVEDVLALSDERLEAIHDYIQACEALGADAVSLNATIADLGQVERLRDAV